MLHHHHLGFSHTTIWGDSKAWGCSTFLRFASQFSLWLSFELWWHILQVLFSWSHQNMSLEGLQTKARTDLSFSKSFKSFWMKLTWPGSHMCSSWELPWPLSSEWDCKKVISEMVKCEKVCISKLSKCTILSFTSFCHYWACIVKSKMLIVCLFYGALL